jgi:hypothetical protein
MQDMRAKPGSRLAGSKYLYEALKRVERMKTTWLGHHFPDQ